MIGDKPRTQHQLQTAEAPVQLRNNIQKAQEAIYRLLLEMVKTWPPEDVLTEFKGLFIHHVDTNSSDTIPHLFEIVFSNQESEFRNTLKRSCYILINNWEITRKYKSIHELIDLFSDTILSKPTISPTLKRLREWLRNFVSSQDFQELKLFAARYEDCGKRNWVERYTSYLLVPQYTNLDNPIEQRQAARYLSNKLKEKFKFELAIYTASSQCSHLTVSQMPQPDSNQPASSPAASELVASSQIRVRSPKNPTSLGDEVLRLIRRIIARRGFLSYPNLANIFLAQSRNLRYREFKQSLLEYLLFSIENQEFVELLKNHLSEKLQNLYIDHDEKIVDNALLLRTTNRLIETLTTETPEFPSPLFVGLLSSGNPIVLVIILLKLVLMCPYARTHLEVRIANLIRHYEKFSEEDCQWVIHFFEIFNIIMIIFTENVEYNLVMMNTVPSESSEVGIKTYRIFSQSRHRP
jgi:hypothetical protein